MISVYTDGSSTGRSNQPGGWSYVLVEDGQEIAQGHGGDPKTTNNRMELMGAIQGLKALLTHPNRNSGMEADELVSDSQYVLGLAAGEYRPKKNVDLATELRRLAIKAKIKTRWVRGHTKDTYNEKCDVLAKAGKEEHALDT